MSPVDVSDTPAARPVRKHRIVTLVPVGTVDGKLVGWLAEELQSSFACFRCAASRAFAPRAESLGEGGRYPSDTLLDELLEWDAATCAESGPRWLLAVTELDLSAPDRPWVFGQATVGGSCAVVSIARLRPDAPAANGEGLALLRTRLLKEAVHELGHVAGLGHCPKSGCVMASSPDVAAADAKPSTFCFACQRALRDQPPGRA